MLKRETDTLDEYMGGFKPEIGRKLARYAELIEKYNLKFNLTGHSTFNEIFHGLIGDSILPLRNLHVPRGTRFADIGTGAGIPGVPIGIIHPEAQGVLIEARQKKADFIKEVIDDLDLPNLQVICGRAEELAFSPELRENFNYVFSRALAGLYVVLELALPYLKIRGKLFIYSKVQYTLIQNRLLDHARMLGGSCLNNNAQGDFPGILVFNKIRETPGTYPRRFAAIKREAEKSDFDQ